MTAVFPRHPAAPRRRLVAALALTIVVLSSAVAAQTVQSITASTPDLGNVVSAPTGTTVFRVASGSGVVTRISGTGARLSTASSRPLVTIACGAGSCNNVAVKVRVGAIGTPTLRAGALTNFTITAGTASITVAPTGTGPVDFTIAGMPQGSTRTFYVGADVPILGNDSAAATGNATTRFYVYVSLSGTPTAGSTAGTAIARVFRPISVTGNTNLAFGRIVRPTTGTGTVVISQVTGARTLTGTGTTGLATPAPTRATYTVSGEGAQAFSLSYPATFQMTGPGPALTVTLTGTATGAQVLSSTLGTAGTFTFGIGGSFPISSTTTTGAYSGSYAVTVQYN